MNNEIKIFVISNEIDDNQELIKGGPASISSKIADKVIDGIKNINVDKNTLCNCMQSTILLVQKIKEQTKLQEIVYPDSVTIQLGITSGGTVGLIGTGVDVKLATTISVTLKICN